MAVKMPPKWKRMSRLTTTRRAVRGSSTSTPATAATAVMIQNNVAAEKSQADFSATSAARNVTPAALKRTFQEPGRIVTAAPAAASPTSKSATQTAVQD